MRLMCIGDKYAIGIYSPEQIKTLIARLEFLTNQSKVKSVLISTSGLIEGTTEDVETIYGYIKANLGNKELIGGLRKELTDKGYSIQILDKEAVSAISKPLKNWISSGIKNNIVLAIGENGAQLMEAKEGITLEQILKHIGSQT